MKNNEKIISKQNNQICKIFDCYRLSNDNQNKQGKNCLYCSFDYKKNYEIAEQIREEILKNNINLRRINVKAKVIEYIIITIASFSLIYGLVYFYLKLKH